jgi:hypothetical protein
MAELGTSTADDLERQLTSMINLWEECRMDSIRYVPPTKTKASEILHTAYLLVQQNAARLKGWGGLHDRVDTHIMVLRRCVSMLEDLAGQEGNVRSAGNGICQATSTLVGDLQDILSDWKRRLAGPLQSTASISPITMSSGEVDSLAQLATQVAQPVSSNSETAQRLDISANNIFATWEMWPQSEDIDFSQFIDFDYDPETSDSI